MKFGIHNPSWWYGTELAEAFRAASESEDPEPALWRLVSENAAAVAVAERQLWTALSSH